jgi:uncharacterized protein
MLTLSAVVVALMMLQGVLMTKTHRASAAESLITIAASILALAAYAGLVLFGERRHPSELSYSGSGRELVSGLAIGLSLFALAVLLMAACGAYAVKFNGAAPSWSLIGVALGPPVREELLFRAILFRLLWRAFGIQAALLLSAIMFGALHLVNPNATLWSACAIAMEAGFMLAAFFALTGRLWLPIGVHAGWNLSESWIFGAPISGIVVKRSLWSLVPLPNASVLLTGGSFGPEASLLTVIIGTSCGAIVLWKAWRSSNLHPVGQSVLLSPEHGSALTGHD